MCQNFSKYHNYLVSTTHIFFSNVTLFYVTVPNFFPIYCYFMSTIPPPPQTSVVKTLPLQTPISLVLSFFSNEFPIQFLHTNQISFQFQQYKTDLHAIFQFMFFHFSLYISATPPPYQSQYSPTANIINYLDPGTMPQQNSTVIISTTVLETVSSSQLINHPFIPG